MTTVSFHYFIQPRIHAPIQHNIQLDGSPTSTPGVTAVVARMGGLGWCLLCDHPGNVGVSVTNGAQSYAEAVCRTLQCDITDLAWYELDSMGKFDELQLMGSTVGYAPLLQEGLPPRSLQAFFARTRRFPAGLPIEAAAVIQRQSELFEPN